MKRSIKSVIDFSGGESYRSIFRYFYPEFVTALLLYSLPYFIDCYFIGCLKSTMLYTISGVVDNTLNMFIKIAEGLSIGTVILGGYYNGKKDFPAVGNTLVHAFWTSLLVGACISFGLYIGAPWIYAYFKFDHAMIQIGAPYLQLRALAIFCMFLYFSLVGFLRAIKNTWVPMVIFGIGSALFVVVDYILIFGTRWTPGFGLYGSAIASCIQAASMVIMAIWYISGSGDNTKYMIQLYKGISSWKKVWSIVCVAIPIVIDKATMAWAYVWLASMLAPMGTYALASFSVIKLIERFAFVPAVALAQVITFLVSNAMGRKDWNAVVVNIIKVLSMASALVLFVLFIISMYPEYAISLVDQNQEFGALAAKVFPALSVLVFFDLLQLILSGALRGALKVYVVMITRLCVIIFYFMPVSYWIAHMHFSSLAMHFFATYSSFFIGNALMSVVYISWFIKYGYSIKTIKVDHG